MAATKEDAQLVVQLAALGGQMADPRARGFIWGEGFTSDPKEFFEKHPPGTDEWNYVGGVASWYETIGTLWKHGLLDEDLLFDWLWVAGMWERLGPILVAMRDATPALWANFEAMSEAQAARS
jgi:hypothetical protein